MDQQKAVYFSHHWHWMVASSSLLMLNYTHIMSIVLQWKAHQKRKFSTASFWLSNLHKTNLKSWSKMGLYRQTTSSAFPNTLLSLSLSLPLSLTHTHTHTHTHTLKQYLYHLPQFRPKLLPAELWSRPLSYTEYKQHKCPFWAIPMPNPTLGSSLYLGNTDHTHLG